VRLSIDVVLVAFNHWALTESCLRHLAAQTREHRVVLVDNGSTDETPSRVAADWPGVHHLRLDRNLAFTRAVNAGVAAGAGDCVVLLNNDVDLQPDCLEQLVAPLERDAAVGSVATLMLRPGEQAIDSMGITVDPTLAAFARLQGQPPERAADAVPRLAGPEGTAAAYRRAAWEQVGGLDEGMEAYMEIVDLALRLRTAGWATAAAPRAVGVHLGSATFVTGSVRQRRLAGFSRGYMLRRYGVLRSRQAARTLLTEAVAVAGDAVRSRDLHALAGRVAGWRGARGRPRHPAPPADALEPRITFTGSLALRRGPYVVPANRPQVLRRSSARSAGEADS
jgi:N-acetylglucosaminyl-diphospho-decaprenol L-rhamnosyltransferase